MEESKQPDAVVILGMADMRPVRETDDYGEKVDRWVLEEERPLEGSVFQRIPPMEVDHAVTRMRRGDVVFGRRKESQEYGSPVKIADIGPGEANVAIYGQGFGQAYRLREVSEGDVPDEVMELFPDSWREDIPLKGKEYLELLYVQEMDHDYDLGNLSGEEIDEAQRALNGIDEKLERGDYDDRAFGYSSGFLL